MEVGRFGSILSVAWVKQMNAMKLRLLLIGGIIAAIGAARVALAGVEDSFAWLLVIGIVLLGFGLLWK